MIVRPSTRYLIECLNPDGSLAWREDIWNLVVTTGLNELILRTFKAVGYTAAWYVGFTDASPVFAAEDTMASHGGWAEETGYSGSVRPLLILGDVAAGAADNSASRASVVASGSVTIGGVFLSSSQEKGSTSDVLYGGAAFSTSRNLVTSQQLNVTATLVMSPAPPPPPPPPPPP